MKNWKKNLMAAAVLLVVCAGIYMNWMYSNAENVDNLADTLDAEKVLSDDGLVLDANNLENEVNDGNNTNTDYFAAVRLSRQEARDSAVSLLQEAMAYSEDGEAEESNAQLEQIVQTALAVDPVGCGIVLVDREKCFSFIA